MSLRGSGSLGGSGNNKGPQLGKSVGDSQLGFIDRESSSPANSSTVAQSLSCEDLDVLDVFS